MTTFYACVDGNGLPTAWYNDDLFPPSKDGSLNAAIPAGAVALTAAQWQDCIDNNGLRRIVDGAPSVYAPPPPAAPPAQFTFLQFMALFTSAEQAAIVGSTDTQVKLFLLMAAGATYVSPADPRTANALAYLVSQGLLTQDRENAITSASAPTS